MEMFFFLRLKFAKILKKIPDLYENWKYTNAEIKKNINLFLKKWKKIPCMV